MKRKFLAVLLAGAMVLGVTACGSSKDSSKSTTEAVKKEETTTITLAAAASLEKMLHREINSNVRKKK